MLEEMLEPMGLVKAELYEAPLVAVKLPGSPLDIRLGVDMPPID